MRIPTILLAATTVFAVSAAPAAADDVGEVGTIVRLQRNTDSADTYLQYHGRLFVRPLDGPLVEYRWGGTSCGTRVLTDSEFESLQAAQNNKKMLVQVLSQLGQGNVPCVVSVSFVEKKNLKLFP